MADNNKWKVVPTKYRRNKSAPEGKTPYQGFYIPANQDKYDGNVDSIIFRSGMELRLFKYLDTSTSVISWSSEETIIPYVSPKDNKIHRYFMDAKVTVKKKDETIRTYLIEVKPKSQCAPPKAPKTLTKKSRYRFIQDTKTFDVNSAKWDAATKLCESKDWDFLILTEKDLRF